MEQVLIGFGSNLGDSVQTCVAALERLRMHPLLRVLKTSSFYRTSPLMLTAQPWFINGVVLCETDLSPEDLLGVILEIEKDFGRDRQIRWGPRILDLDLLAYGDRQVDLPILTIPHPRLHERRFVLEPLLEIAPDWVHPTLNIPARNLLSAMGEEDDTQEVQRLESS
jgi:2-amino-4-hydroxy-6-hydroxymethyldihydropteridine diphosphokinase